MKVRQAICYALDKDMVNEFVAGGNGTLISSAMLPTLKDYYEDLNDLYGTSANVEKAKELLTEADMQMDLILRSQFRLFMSSTCRPQRLW